MREKILCAISQPLLNGAQQVVQQLCQLLRCVGRPDLLVGEYKSQWVSGPHGVERLQ